MAPIVVIIEDIDKDSNLIKQWIEGELQDVQVWRCHDPREAEEKLERHQRDVSCVVLDMFFPSLISPNEEAQGQRILDRFPNIPTILISQRAESRTMRRKKYVPLLQLDKPADLFPISQPAHTQEVNEFQRDLIEAIHCCLLIYSLRSKLAEIERKRTWQPLLEMRTGIAVVTFAVLLIAYATSVIFFNEFIQHLFLAVCAVTLVHLLDRVVLFKDFKEALQELHKRLDELSIEKERTVEESKTGVSDQGSNDSIGDPHAPFAQKSKTRIRQ